MVDKENINPMKTVSFRVPQELYQRITDAVEASQETQAIWLRDAIEFALQNMAVKKPGSSKDEIINILANDPAIEELLYHKIAEKLKLKDIVTELSDFATHCQTNSAADLNVNLREMAARIKFLIPDPAPTRRLISGRTVTCIIDWKKEWTLEDFIALSPDETAEFEVFHMECRDPANPDRATGIYFWNYYEDALSYFTDNYFDPGECVIILGGKISCDEEITEKLSNHLVNMVRYAARDNNIGKPGNLKDSEYVTYNIIQSGLFPAGIPYEFTFGWVSEALCNGEYGSDEEFRDALVTGSDKTIHPEVSARWHYTGPEERRYGLDGQTPFLRHAVPENIICGRYVDSEDTVIPRVVKPILEVYDDPGRVDREGYPRRRQQ